MRAHIYVHIHIIEEGNCIAMAKLMSNNNLL